MSTPRVLLLGLPRLIDAAGQEVQLRKKGWGLLAYLLLEQRSHTRDALAVLFWPGQEPVAARANLRRELARLRAALGKEPLTCDRETLRLSPKADIWTDIDQFHIFLAAANDHRHAPELLCDVCLERRCQALACYRGEFLEGLGLTDLPAFDDWRFFKAEALRQELTGTLERLIADYTRRGAFPEAIACARRWVELNPLHEPAHRQLMRLYAWSGRRSAALRQFRQCCRRLADELDVRPAGETIVLGEAIEKRRFTHLPSSRSNGGPARTSARLPPNFEPDGQLPRPNNAFIGREQEHAALLDLLRDSRQRLLTVVGPSGSGRTRLLVETAAGARPAKEMCYLPFEGFDPTGVDGQVNPLIPRLATALKLTLHGGTDPLGQVVAYLAEREHLLVLDDLDRLLTNRRFLETADLLPLLVDGAPGLALLVAAGRRLGVAGEWVLPLRPLAYPESIVEIDAMTEKEAVRAFPALQLFAARARLAGADFSLPASIELCRLVRGLPLGIELAAAGTRWEPAASLAGRATEMAAGANGERPETGGRARGVQVLWKCAWERLTPADRRALRRLVPLRGRIVPAAVAAAGVHRAALAELAGQGLVTRLPGGAVLLHEMLRGFALAADG